MIHVEDNYRKNPLSNRPGGVTVIVKYKPGRDGTVKTVSYDKVKNPEAFIKKIKLNNPNIDDVWVKL